VIINLNDIPEEGIYYRGEEPAEILELEDDLIFSALSPVAYNLYVQTVCEELIVNGRVSAEVQVRCSRCMEIFSTKIEDSAFLRTFPLEGSELEMDVTSDIREAIILNLPLFLLCDEDCKGRCPHCGKNLNEGSCECTEEEGPNAWDVLSGLKF
jgi:uncharacterized protein